MTTIPMLHLRDPEVAIAKIKKQLGHAGSAAWMACQEVANNFTPQPEDEIGLVAIGLFLERDRHKNFKQIFAETGILTDKKFRYYGSWYGILNVPIVATAGRCKYIENFQYQLQTKTRFLDVFRTQLPSEIADHCRFHLKEIKFE